MYRVYACALCSYVATAADMEGHLKICPEGRVECSMCREQVKRNEVSELKTLHASNFILGSGSLSLAV